VPAHRSAIEYRCGKKNLMNKKKILLASILKPVNDTRMYEKFGISLAKTNKYEIHIAGFNSSDNPATMQSCGIYFHPIFNFTRLSIMRLFASLKFCILLLNVKPQLIILNTPELLIVTCSYQILFGSKLLYDVQENYYRNIAYTNVYAPIIRNILAIGVRCVEYITRPFIDHYFLAERNYELEFSFTKGKSTIIENKYKELNSKIEIRNPKFENRNPKIENRKSKIQNLKSEIRSRVLGTKSGIYLLYSGTISESTGIFEAIDLAKLLYKIDKHITLAIIGYCALQKTLKKIIESIHEFDFINLIGGNVLVPHTNIIDAIQMADFGLVSYQPNKSDENCLPTKMFEYMAHKLPMIVQYNPLFKVRNSKFEIRNPKSEIRNYNWESFCKQHKAGIIIDYKNFDPQILYNKMLTQKFYPKGKHIEVFWNTEEEKLIDVVRKVI